MALTTLSASLSSNGSMLLMTLALETDPSFSMTNETITRPSTLASTASLGYWIFWPSHSIIAFPPPGNSGISSRYSKTFSSCTAGWANLKLTGRVNWHLAGWPSCIPGFQLGIALTTLSASLSSDSCTPFVTLALDIEPSFSMMNETITRPSILPSTASFGYCIFWLSHCIIAACPPGNSGISSR